MNVGGKRDIVGWGDYWKNLEGIFLLRKRYVMWGVCGSDEREMEDRVRSFSVWKGLFFLG